MTAITRRGVLATGAASALTLAAPPVLAALPARADPLVGPDRIWMCLAGRDEELIETLKHETKTAAAQALGRIFWFFRDWKSNDRAHWIDTDLIHVLSRIQIKASKRLGREARITLISGYRTPERNRRLKGAAPNSFHIHGRAADIRILGLSSRRLAALARDLGAGGVGTYPRSGFVHIDTGPRRNWRG